MPNFNPDFTLRDLFAAAALIPLLHETPMSEAKVAQWAFDAADAMLAARREEKVPCDSNGS
jgi:hypothetical protein